MNILTPDAIRVDPLSDFCLIANNTRGFSGINEKFERSF